MVGVCLRGGKGAGVGVGAAYTFRMGVGKSQDLDALCVLRGLEKVAGGGFLLSPRKLALGDVSSSWRPG